MTYVGTVKGNLRNGTVTGTGDTTKGKKRLFTFEGTAKDGVVTMQCYEVTQGKSPQGKGEFRVSD